MFIVAERERVFLSAVSSKSFSTNYNAANTSGLNEFREQAKSNFMSCFFLEKFLL